jgi:hypothetical protein
MPDPLLGRPAVGRPGPAGDATRPDLAEVPCACGLVGCVETVRMPRRAYDALRLEPWRALVHPTHALPEAGAALAVTEDYVVVEQRPGRFPAAAGKRTPQQDSWRIALERRSAYRRVPVPKDNIELRCSRSPCRMLLSLPGDRLGGVLAMPCPACRLGVLELAADLH